MLKLIKLKRFKKFQDVEVHLRPFTVLMGENSSGKTTILQAINSAMILLAGSGLVTGINEKIKIRKAGAPMFALPGVILEDYKGLFYGNVPRGGKAKGVSGIEIGLIDDNSNHYRIVINYLFGGLNVKCDSKAKELSNNPTITSQIASFDLWLCRFAVFRRAFLLRSFRRKITFWSNECNH